MGKEYNRMKKEFIRGVLKMGRNVGLGNLNIRIKTIMKVNGEMTKGMERLYSEQLMGMFIKGSLKIIMQMGKVY